jgi:cobalt/nickel transport system ATP-binding protein
MTSLFSLRGVSFAYPGSRAVLDGIDLDLDPGERLAIIGGNGSGKTTLLHVMVGLRKPTAGRIVAFGAARVREADFRQVRARAGLLFQDSDDQLFCPTVIEDVAFGPLNLGKSRSEAIHIAEQALSALGLDGFGPRITHRLSGGEKRLVTLATVLAMQPDALLLDEPTNGLDADAANRLIEHVRSLPQAVLFVSHDTQLIARLAHRALLLRDGKLEAALVHTHSHAHAHRAHPHGGDTPTGDRGSASDAAIHDHAHDHPPTAR